MTKNTNSQNDENAKWYLNRKSRFLSLNSTFCSYLRNKQLKIETNSFNVSISIKLRNNSPNNMY